MSVSFSFGKLGNEYPSENERLILQAAIDRDEARLKPIQKDLFAAEEQFLGTQKAFQLAEGLLRDATLRLRAISSTMDTTKEALQLLERAILSDEEQALLDNTPAKGISHLSIASKIIKQQEATKKALSKRISILEAARTEAEAALAKEGEAISVAKIQLCGSEEDLRMYKDQYTAVDASIKARRSRFSAIRKVSPEVWTQIFQLIVSSPQQPYLKSLSTKAVFNPALPLRQVCKLWSRVLLKSPSSLWGHIYTKTLALEPSDQDFINYCLERNGHNVSVLYVQTWVGQVSQARNLVASFEGSVIEEVQIHATQDSIKAGEYLIANLPTPASLSICNEVSEPQQKPNFLVFKTLPRDLLRLSRVSLKNDAFFIPQNVSTPIPQNFVRDLSMLLIQPAQINSILGDCFINLETFHFRGTLAPRDPNLKAIYKFLRLRYITGPLSILVLTFDERYQLPALSKLGLWIDDGTVPGMAQWSQFLCRDGLRNRLSSIEIHDMEEENAGKMGDYLQQIGSFSSLTLQGRSVDVLARFIVGPNAGACKLILQSIIVQAYLGDGSSILDLVNAYAAAPAAIAIKEVSWVDCCNVTLQMRTEVRRRVDLG